MADLQMVVEQRKPVASPNEVTLALCFRTVDVLRLLIERQRVVAYASNVLVDHREFLRAIKFVSNHVNALLQENNLIYVL